MTGFEPFVKEFFNKNSATLFYSDGKELTSNDYAKLFEILLKGAVAYAATNGEFKLKESFIFKENGTVETLPKVLQPVKNLTGKLVVNCEDFLEELMGTSITRLL